MRDACGGGHPADGRTPFHPADGRTSTAVPPDGVARRVGVLPGTCALAGGFQPVPFQRPPPHHGRAHRTRAREASGPGPGLETPAVETGSRAPFARDARAETPPMRRKHGGTSRTPPRSPPTSRSRAATKPTGRRRRRSGGDIGARLPPRRFGVEGESVNLRRVTIVGVACRRSLVRSRVARARVDARPALPEKK